MRIFIVGMLLISLSACSHGKIPSSTVDIHSSSYEEKFEAMKNNTPKLISFMYKFPKGADLHNHVTGAAYIEYIILSAAKDGYFYDKENLKIVKKQDKNGQYILVSELLKNEKELLKYLNIVNNRGWHKNTMDGSAHFFNAFSHIELGEWEDELLARILARNHDQGVRYMELMTGVVDKKLIAPLYEFLPKAKFDMNNLPKNYESIDAYLHAKAFSNELVAYMDKLQKAIDDILRKKYNISILGDRPDIVVNFILQLRRSETPYQTFIRAAAYMRASQIDKRIVAINMVQNEAGLNSLKYFTDQMEILDFLWHSLNKPNIALHAGELVLRESPVEPMRNRISQSIIKGHAKRIGHGIAIAWEKDVQGTLKMMKDEGIAVEICLSSNDMILDISGKDHPLALYLEAGVPATLATDDEGISRSNLSMEYVKAAQDQNLTYAQLKQIAKNGLKYSFLEGEGIYTKTGSIDPKYIKYLSGDLPKIGDISPPSPNKKRIKISTKKYLQIRHERDLISFEEKALAPLQ